MVMYNNCKALPYIASYFEAFIFREQPLQFLFAKSNFTNGDTEPHLLHSIFFTILIFEDWLCSYKRLENNPLYGIRSL